MFRKFLMLSLAMLTIGSSLLVAPQARAEVNEVRNYSTTVESAGFRVRRFGPYATLRRANEVANYARSLGYNAKIIYGGTVDYREYYVDVW